VKEWDGRRRRSSYGRRSGRPGAPLGPRQPPGDGGTTPGLGGNRQTRPGAFSILAQVSRSAIHDQVLGGRVGIDGEVAQPLELEPGAAPRRLGSTCASGTTSIEAGLRNVVKSRPSASSPGFGRVNSRS
jgi:hypothetical protein